jgi:hypothetical protein
MNLITMFEGFQNVITFKHGYFMCEYDREWNQSGIKINQTWKRRNLKLCVDMPCYARSSYVIVQGTGEACMYTTLHALYSIHKMD